MKSPRTWVFLAMTLALVQPVLGGESYLIDRGAPMPGIVASLDAVVKEAKDGKPMLYLLAEGKVYPYQWLSPAYEAQPVFAEDVGRMELVDGGPYGRFFLFLLRNGQDYQQWQQKEGRWGMQRAGSFGSRLTALCAGHFTPGGEAGLFLQFDTGKIAYWLLDKDGYIPVWQSPAAETDPIAMTRSGDLDGDRLDELVTVDAKGAVKIRKWRNDMWETIWSLPPWGQVLGLDLQAVDNQPGLTLVFTTSQRRFFRISAQKPAAAGGNQASTPSQAVFTSKTYNLSMIATQAALVPGGNGAVLLADAAGTLYLMLPGTGAEVWKLESQLGGGERLTFMTGLEPLKVIIGTVGGALHFIDLTPLNRLETYLDGQLVGNTGLYWQDGQFYFSPDFLLRTLNLKNKWEQKKGTLTLTSSKTSAALTVNKAEALINNRPWPLGHPLVLVGKTPYVPADLLSAVFLVNVTYDPEAGWLILTSAAPSP